MRTRAATMLFVSLLSFLTTPVLAANFFCPIIQILPPTFNLSTRNPSQPQLNDIQAFLNNLRSITTAYRNGHTEGARNEIANCLMDHLVALHDNGTLEHPVTPADGATWFLLRAEAINSLNIAAPSLRFKPELPFIANWLNTIPQYTPPAIASR